MLIALHGVFCIPEDIVHTSLLFMTHHYKEKQQLIMKEAVDSLAHAAPSDIVVNNVLPFLELPRFSWDSVLRY